MGMNDWRKTAVLLLAVLIPVAEYYLAVSLYLQKTNLYEQAKFMMRLFTAAFALYVIMQNANSLRWRTQAFIVNTGAWILYLLILSSPFRHWIGFCWILITASALTFFIEPQRLWQHIKENRAIVYFCAIALASQIFYLLTGISGKMQQVVWLNFLAEPTVGIPRTILDLLGYGMESGMTHSLRTPLLDLSINTACSGLEGITFFITVFSFMMMLDYKLLPTRTIVLGYLTGIVFMWALNLFRITAFFMFGSWAVEQWGEEKGGEFALNLFHNNVGWILYAVGIGIYFILFYRMMNKTAQPDSRQQ
jgi:exosortase/archaeosortase family protein